MDALAVIRACTIAVPPLRGVWRRLMERQLEATVLARPPEREPVIRVTGGDPEMAPAGLYANLRLRLQNHRTDRAEHIAGCSLALKRKRWRYWRKTLLEVPVVRRSDHRPLDVHLEPLSSPTEVDVTVGGAHPDPSLILSAEQLSGAEIVLRLEMVGPIRKRERVVGAVR